MQDKIVFIVLICPRACVEILLIALGQFDAVLRKNQIIYVFYSRISKSGQAELYSV